MKYGILMYINTDNIGDDIQSYAQKRFLPSVDCVVDRENLDAFGRSENLNETVSVIMNAFYMYDKFNWPPAACINPLFVSMHITQNDFFGIGDRFLDAFGGDYLRHYEPIGARDEATLNLLKNKGINAYLSGCMTLTLSVPGEAKKNDVIILTDVDEDLAETIKQKYPEENYIELSHAVDTDIHSKLTMEERFTKVEDLLKRYRNAKCVITERLHCALPCLALGTPVLLIYKEDFSARMSSFLPLLHSATYDEIRNGLCTFNICDPPENSSEYLKYRIELECCCKAFIEKSKTGDVIIPLKFEEGEISEWQKNLIRNSEEPIRKRITKESKWINELEKSKKWFLEQIESRSDRITELEAWATKQDEAKEWFLEQIAIKDAKIEEMQAEYNKQAEYTHVIEEQLTEYKQKNLDLQAELELEINKPWYKKIVSKN